MSRVQGHAVIVDDDIHRGEQADEPIRLQQCLIGKQMNAVKDVAELGQQRGTTRTEDEQVRPPAFVFHFAGHAGDDASEVVDFGLRHDEADVPLLVAQMNRWHSRRIEDAPRNQPGVAGRAKKPPPRVDPLGRHSAITRAKTSDGRAQLAGGIARQRHGPFQVFEAQPAGDEARRVAFLQDRPESIRITILQTVSEQLRRQSAQDAGALLDHAGRKWLGQFVAHCDAHLLLDGQQEDAMLFEVGFQ